MICKAADVHTIGWSERSPKSGVNHGVVRFAVAYGPSFRIGHASYVYSRTFAL